MFESFSISRSHTVGFLPSSKKAARSHMTRTSNMRCILPGFFVCCFLLLGCYKTERAAKVYKEPEREKLSQPFQRAVKPKVRNPQRGQWLAKREVLKQKLLKLKRGMFVINTLHNQTVWYLSYRLTCPRTVDKPVARFIPYVGVEQDKNVWLRVKIIVCAREWIHLRSWKLITESRQIAGDWSPHQVIREAKDTFSWEEAEIPILPQRTPRIFTLKLFLRRMLNYKHNFLELTGKHQTYQFQLKEDTKLTQKVLTLYDTLREQTFLNRALSKAKME